MNYSEASGSISEGEYNFNFLDEGFSNQTTLHWAARNINGEASTILLDAGANPRLRDSGKRVPFPTI